MKVAISLLLIMCSNVCIAQNKIFTPPPGTTFIRFNPLGLLDPGDMNISVGAERFIRPRLSVASDIAFIFRSSNFAQARRSTGFVFRPAIRFYPNRTAFFLEGELHYKQVNHQIRDWLGMDAVNGIPSYERFTDFTYRRNTYGFHLKAGRIMQSFLGTNLWWEVYAGVGARFYQFKVVRQPRSVYDRTRWFDLDREGIRYSPVVPMGLRVMWKVKR